MYEQWAQWAGGMYVEAWQKVSESSVIKRAFIHSYVIAAEQL